jgi:hypothetical protein
MPTLLCLDGYTWLNLDLVTQIQYAAGGWHVRLCGDAAFLSLTPEQGAVLAAWVRAHAPTRPGAPTASPRPVAPRRRIRPPVHG